MSIVRPDREPASTDGEKYHSIRLYEELPVVILPVDHVLTVLDEVPVEELAEEFLHGHLIKHGEHMVHRQNDHG